MLYNAEQQIFSIAKTRNCELEIFQVQETKEDWVEIFVSHVKHYIGGAAITLQEGIKKWGLYQEETTPKTILSLPIVLEQEIVAFFHFAHCEDENIFHPEVLKLASNLCENINGAFQRSNIMNALKKSEILQQQMAEQLESLSGKLAKYLSPHVYDSIFNWFDFLWSICIGLSCLKRNITITDVYY